jgi:N-methylhydantoinase A
MTSIMRPLDDWSDAARRRVFADLATGLPTELARHRWFARMRYAGQGHELDVGLSPKKNQTHAIRTAFIEAHEARYGFSLAVPIEVVSARIVAEGKGRRAQLHRRARIRRASIRGPRSVPLPDATLFVARGWTAAMIDANAWELRR